MAIQPFMVPMLVQNDPYLEPFSDAIKARIYRYEGMKRLIEQHAGSIYNFADQHLYLGFNYDKKAKGWWYREWAPNAFSLHLIGDFNQWDRYAHPLKMNDRQVWEIFLPDEKYGDKLTHQSLLKVVVAGRNGSNDRIPALIKRVVQDPVHLHFTGQLWAPSKAYKWKNDSPVAKKPLDNVLIYEAHVGMAQQEGKVGSYSEFKEKVLPRIKDLGYTCIQLMAIQEHPYYGSYGYHVANFFAPSSRFGTPEELKDLIDTAHGLGIAVIIDCVHSHSVKNILEGLNEFDGTDYQYFLPGHLGDHPLWDSKLFNYGKTEVLQFLLSNIRYWMEEFNVDGFRFDGVTSMLYRHHGLSKEFSSMHDYFGPDVNEDALLYLTLANELIHAIRPNAISVAEEVSGMPGLCRPADEGGVGFDYRLGMGQPDYWIKLLKEQSDENWDLGDLWWAMTNRRYNEKTIAYAESHDQALVGDQTIAFRLMGPSMYSDMAINIPSLIVDRGIALHKLIRLFTITLGGEGYLNFMGNEFGHPEWIDFPREGNNWSYDYARRQWSLADSPFLRYQFLLAFDKLMVSWVKENNILQLQPKLLEVDRNHQIISIRKGKYLIIFNFHPTESAWDYPLGWHGANVHKLVFTTDDPALGGFGRLEEDSEHWPNEDGEMRFYLPNRAAMVFIEE